MRPFSNSSPGGCDPGTPAESEEPCPDLLFKELYDAIPQAALIADSRSFHVLHVNRAAAALFKQPPEALAGMTLPSLFPEEGRLTELLIRAGHDHEIYSASVRHKGPNSVESDLFVRIRKLHGVGKPAVLLLAEKVAGERENENRAVVFAHLGRSLSQARSPKEAGLSIVEAADRLFGWDACLFGLVGPDQDSLIPVLAVDTLEGGRQELEAGRPVDLGPETRKVFDGGAVLTLRDHPTSFPPGAEPFGNTGRPSASLMAVPVRAGERILAVLSVQSYTHGAYSQGDLGVLESLAEHCSGALERLRAEEEIQRLHTELRGHLEELQTLFEVAPVGIAVAHDAACRTMSLNAACAAMFGLTEAEYCPNAVVELATLPIQMMRNGQKLAFEEHPMRCAARQSASIAGQELELVRPDGRTVFCYCCASPLFDIDSTTVRGSVAVFVNLTDRKNAEFEIRTLNAELERRVRDRTRQLEAINRELEAFSYSVSHDLRAPLRSIRGFSEVLLERYGPQLDDRGREFLRRTCDSCAHMDKLIEDLLKLSRVGRAELHQAIVDLSSLAEQSIAELRKTEPQRQVDVQVAPGLITTGDERLLKVALDNLVRNAWKFTANEPRARIEVGRAAEPENTFFVKDNGAGFDMAYASKLFGVFQRLHTAAEFPGTGVGLATVQRIINRHGGTVWGTGQVNQGATFYFTLPPNPES